METMLAERTVTFDFNDETDGYGGIINQPVLTGGPILGDIALAISFLALPGFASISII